MKIAIDATAITTARGNFGDKSGVYRYTLNLIKGLIKQKKETDSIYLLDFLGTSETLIPSELYQLTNQNDIFFKSFSKPSFFHFNNTKLSEIQGIRWFAKKLDKYILDQIYKHIGWHIYVKNINKFLTKKKIDIIHFSDTVYFPTKIKNVLTVHDLVPFIFPELQRQETIEIHERRKKFIEYHANGVICVSKNTQKDFNRICKTNIPTKVIYEGSDDSFFKINQNEFKSTLKKTSNVKLQKLNWKEYYLSYGTLEPRKNLGTLLNVYSNLYFNGKTNKKLIIIGGNGWGNTFEKIQNFIEENSLNKQIILFGFTSDRILNAVLNGSYCLIYPSIYEGFGLPPLEAMSLGVPTITSNSSSLPEVVGDEALTFSPININELENLIIKINDQKVWEKYSNYGIKRSQKFSWDITAKETLNFYENIINESL